MFMERIIGLDVGDRTIGVAVSDPLLLTAQGLTTIHRKSWSDDMKTLGEIINNYQAKKIVVGLPINMNGSLGPQGEKTKEFVARLLEEFDLEVIYQDERLSTMAAQRTLIEADVTRKKRKGVIDKLASTYILQTYLDKIGRN